MFFPVVMYGCESWTVKKAEHRRINAFELWCWRKLLRVPWTARRSNQSVLKEISPGISLGGMMLKLKLQYFGHPMRRVDSLEKTLMLGGTGGRGEGDDREWDGWMTSRTWWTWVWVNSLMNREALACCDSWGRKESDTTERLNWTDIFPTFFDSLYYFLSLYCSFHVFSETSSSTLMLFSGIATLCKTYAMISCIFH